MLLMGALPDTRSGSPADLSNPGQALAGGYSAVPKRVVSIGPNLTETIFALGRGDHVVGVTDFCTYPPEVRNLPKVGGYINPNLERLLALGPDLVIVRGKHEKVDRFCRSKAIPILHVNMDSLSSIYEGIIQLGSVFRKVERAQMLCEAIRHQLKAVSRHVSQYPRLKVFISLGRAPGSLANIYTAGGPSFMTEILKIAGGDNIFEDVKKSYPEVSKESLIRRAPEVIFEMRPGEDLADARRKQIREDWKVLRGVPAIANGRIHILTEDYLLIPGPRVGVATRFLAETLHPDFEDGS